MRRIDDITLIGTFMKNKATKTGASAAFDTLGYDDVLVTIATGSAATAHKFYFYHQSASTTTSTSGTAFGTLPTLTTAATASQRHVNLIEGQVARKRYLLIKLSTLGASCGTCTMVHGINRRGGFPASSHGAYTSAFRSLV